MSKIYRAVALLTACVVLFSAASCGKTPTESTVNSSTVSGEASSATGSYDDTLSGTSDVLSGNESGTISSVSSSTAGKPSGTQSSSNKPSSQGGSSSTTTAQKTKIFKVEDFGAAGDGVTDDGVAVANAVLAAAKDPSEEKIVQFKAGATYRLASAPASNSFKRVINVIYADNVKIRGNKTKLLMAAPYRVGVFEDSSNIEFSGFIIDYSPKPFSAAVVTAIASDYSYIDFRSDDDLNVKDTITPPSPYFAFRNRKDERLHYNINKVQKLGEKTYRFYMADKSRVAMARVGEEFILPVYGSSHNVGGIISVTSVENFKMKDVTIYAMPDFGVGLRTNTGTVEFTNVRFEPEPGSKVYLVSWRDGFHVKDNLAKLVWDNCYIGPLGDDAFNLSSVICNVDFYNSSTRTVNMIPAEGGNTREGIKAGDELVAYNMKTGKYIGEAKVAAVLTSSNAINLRLDRDLSGLEKGCQVALYCFNKNFVVKDSRIEGTVRVRSTGTFENCKFNVFWVRVENESYVEGPVPKDITFKNCTFTTPYSTNPKIFHVGTLKATGYTGMPDYKCKNIVLDGCKFIGGTYGADAGNELIVK